MNNKLDHKAWKAARKAGLIVHKLPIADEACFIVSVPLPLGKLKLLPYRFTAEGIVAAAKETNGEAEGIELLLDVPCVSKGL